MTKITTHDNRQTAKPTFEDIETGVMFTDVDCEIIYIKTAPLKNMGTNTTANALDLEGDTHWFDADEEVQPIQEIEITIKK